MELAENRAKGEPAHDMPLRPADLAKSPSKEPGLSLIQALLSEFAQDSIACSGSKGA